MLKQKIEINRIFELLIRMTDISKMQGYCL